MKKLGFTLLLLCAFLLTGCHGAREKAGFALPESFDEAQQYELTFWAKNDTNKAQVRVYENAISAFESLYPNITVTMRLYTDYARIYNDVITNISTNTTPDICITYPDHIATYLSGADVVVPLDTLMADVRYGFGGSELRYDAPRREELVQAYLREGVIGGVSYALPFMRSTEACYINKDYVEKLGYTIPDELTWDFLWEVSEAAMARDADGNFLVNGQKVMIPFIYKSTDNMMIQLLRQAGAGYSDESGAVLLFNDTTKELLYEIAGHARTGAFSTFKISSYPANFLNAGQCIFAIDSTGGSTWMGCDAPLLDIPADRLVRFETVVRPIPQLDPAHPQMISQGPSLCLFNHGDAQQVLASWLFAQFLLTDEVQLAYSATEGFVPVTQKAQQSEAYRDYLARAGEDNDTHYSVKLDAVQMLLDNIDNTFITPVFNGSASLRDASGQLIESTVKSVRRKQSVDEAYMERLFADTASLYRLDSITSDPAARKTLGRLPAASKVLLCSLGAVWLVMGAIVVHDALEKKRKYSGGS